MCVRVCAWEGEVMALCSHTDNSNNNINKCLNDEQFVLFDLALSPTWTRGDWNGVMFAMFCMNALDEPPPNTAYNALNHYNLHARVHS